MYKDWRGSGPGEHRKKFGISYLYLEPLKLATSNLVQNLVLGLAYQKQRSRPILAGVWASGASRKIWDPQIFLDAPLARPLPMLVLNFKFGILGLVPNLSLGLAYQKTTFRTKIGGGLGQGSIRKNLGPPIYFCNRLKNWYTTGLPCQTQVLGPN